MFKKIRRPSELQVKFMFKMWSAWRTALWLIFLPKDLKHYQHNLGLVNYDDDDDIGNDDDDVDDEDDDDNDDDNMMIRFPKSTLFVGW